MSGGHTPAVNTGETPEGASVAALEQLGRTSRAFQDALIARRLPDWLKQVPVEEWAHLAQAMSLSLSHQQQLRGQLARLTGLEAFAAAALDDAFAQRFGTGYNVRTLKFLQGRRAGPIINLLPVASHLHELVYDEVTLLDAALQNFTAEQAQVGGQFPGNRLLVNRPGQGQVPSATAFAALCRELDLGERYQRHLDSILTPPDDAAGVAPLLAGGYRYGMLVDAYRARHTDVLSDSELRLVKQMCLEGTLGRLAGDLVLPRQLRLLGCWLEQIVVFEVVEKGVVYDTTRKVLLYIPGDPHGPWSQFSSMRYLVNEIGRRLRVKAYQQFFSRFVRRRDSQRFFATVIPAYADLPVWANISLAEHLRDCPQPLFDRLADARIAQIKDDAAMIAMPVAALDREVQRVHDERLAAEGWTLLNLAGLFVPAIGLALLAVTAWELLDEAYQGIQAWRDEDSGEALDHLVNVATDLAVLGAIAAGATLASRLWRRSAVVDRMMPAQLEDGSSKLWQEDLTGFRSPLPPAESTVDAGGVHHWQGRAWIEMDGHHYPVAQRPDDGQWHLLARHGHAPALRSNGAGAWRLWSEQPAQWQDRHRMFRRLGGQLRELDDDQIDEVMVCHDLGADQLRALHVYARAPQAGLLDSVQRCVLEQRIRAVVSRLRSGQAAGDALVLAHAQRLAGAAGLSDQALAEHCRALRRPLLEGLYDALQAPDSRASAALRRVFPSVHRRAADELLRAASAVDRQRLLASGRVPLRLAEAARASALEIRLARVYEALQFDMPQNADLARVALGMLDHLPGASAGVRWQLFEGQVGGPLLLSTTQGAQACSLVHANGQFFLHDPLGQAVGEGGELFATLAAAYGPAQRDAVGVAEPFAHNLRVLVTRQAVQRRPEVERLLSATRRAGSFRPPLRLAEGRLGYPLGGCSASRFCQRDQSLTAMLRDLYPTFTTEQVSAWVHRVLQSGREVESALNASRGELAALRRGLNDWAGAVDGSVQDERVSLATTLIDCWRRVTVDGQALGDAADNFRVLVYNTRPEALPEIAPQVSFAHVSELSLLRMNLESIPESFLLAFSRLRILDLGGNRLTRLPQPLLQMPELRELTLTNNLIVLDSGQAATLASCQALRYIDLSHNPLGRGFSLSGLQQLRWLNLRASNIRHLPHAVLDNPDLLYVDLRSNRIALLPERYYQLPVAIRRRIRLAGNPLSNAEVSRLQQALMGPVEASDDERFEAYFDRARQVWGDAVGPRHRGMLIAAWEAVDEGERSERFYRVLMQLTQSADFHINAYALAQRVLGLLQEMAASPELREQLLLIANDEWGCQDGATWCLSNLEVNVRVWRVQSNPGGNSEQELLNLGRRLWRLDEADRLAVQDILERGGNPDQSEVGLAYRLGLRDRLDLPIEVGDMSFRPLAGVDEQRITRVEAQIRQAETTERLARSMVERSFWCRHLERRHSALFAELAEPFHTRVDGVLQDQGLSDLARDQQAKAIQEELRAAERGLMLELTLKALETGAEDSPINVR
ncbi:Plant intracellular Ras-group-related LRR protein 8 [Pseudomonas reidholzensis]|uniref:RING-type E3 ubiquitin transferase n=1 Tax=Pseudomonas reidholzensis TaxID=1785162 RepID=A0A383RTE5_9PSED|nr:NEL-type E3 ubiquitin ligase domain-containing protein [Pseudomonas reidholzensis]SYX90073.1 Plant intracellular Ras-group-related LRR protein 8 [Pseudomonas reidholzensis]